MRRLTIAAKAIAQVALCFDYYPPMEIEMSILSNTRMGLQDQLYGPSTTPSHDDPSIELFVGVGVADEDTFRRPISARKRANMKKMRCTGHDLVVSRAKQLLRTLLSDHVDNEQQQMSLTISRFFNPVLYQVVAAYLYLQQVLMLILGSKD